MAIIGSQFAVVAEAEDIQMSAPLRSENVPSGGPRSYEGTFDLGQGVTGVIRLFADITSRSMKADLTIPSLRFGGAISQPERFTPSGPISKDEPVVYELTQGTAFSPEPEGTRGTHSRPARSPHILLTGSFWGRSSGGDTSGSFTANFCVPDTHCSEINSVAGTYWARATK
jgi:hypothetical protein